MGNTIVYPQNTKEIITIIIVRIPRFRGKLIQTEAFKRNIIQICHMQVGTRNVQTSDRSPLVQARHVAYDFILK